MQLRKLNKRSPPFQHYFTLLFLSSGSFDHLAGETEVETWMGVRCTFFSLLHIVLFASDLFQAFFLQDTDGGSFLGAGEAGIF